jgi:3-oxoacyl-[acyl-carrier-protein] synthase-1
MPMLLCVAEHDRPGRLNGLDDELLRELAKQLGLDFHPEYSGTIAYGRVGVAVALSRARALLYERGVEHVLVAAADSLLTGPTLAAYEAQGRLLTAQNSNGFIPGEAAGAVLVGRESADLFCLGLGFAEERVTVASEEPLRGDGLANAIKKCLADAGCEMHDLDFRITDISGEQYYFKEAALALSRTLRRRKEEFDFWHPADCIGETGAASGTAALAVALAASRKGYAKGPSVLFHSGTDAGQRAAAILRAREAA